MSASAAVAANVSDQSSSSTCELSLPPSVTGPVYGILSLDIHEIKQEPPQQGDKGEETEKRDPSLADDDTTSQKFRVIWWGDSSSKKASGSSTKTTQQPLLTPANIATPFDKSSVSYTIRCTPPKFLKYLNDARSVSLRRVIVSSPELPLPEQTCKLPLQPAVAEARAGGTMAVRLEGCFPLHTAHREAQTSHRKLRVKLCVLWKTNAPHQFPVVRQPPSRPLPTSMANKGATSRTISSPSHTSGGTSAATPSYGNFIEANYGDHHPGPHQPSSSRQLPNTTARPTYRPPPPVMELPAPSPTYILGPTPPYSRFIPTADGPTPSTNSGPYDGSMLFRQRTSLPDPSQIGPPQTSPLEAPQVTLPTPEAAPPRMRSNEEPDACASTALQLAAVYSEPFGFLPSSGTRPSDRHWAELLAADPMFEKQAPMDEGYATSAEELEGRRLKGQVTPRSESRPRRQRKRSVDKSAKKSSAAAPRKAPILPTIPDDIWVYMAVRSLTPADGGPPLPEDLIVRLKGATTATQELHEPKDGYGYYGDEELCDLAMISNSLVVMDKSSDNGGGNAQPRVQAAVELWQGEYQLYGVGRVALDLAPRDLAALSHNALVRMEALVDCVSGWSGAILATCQLLVDISTQRRPLEDSLNARWQQKQQQRDHYPATVEPGVMGDHEGDGEDFAEESAPLSRTARLPDESAAFDTAEVADDVESDRVAHADTQTLSRALTLMDEKVKYLTEGNQTTGLAGGATRASAVSDASPRQEAAISPTHCASKSTPEDIGSNGHPGDKEAAHGDDGAKGDFEEEEEPPAPESTLEQGEACQHDCFSSDAPAGYPVVESTMLGDHEEEGHHPEDIQPERADASTVAPTSNDAEVPLDVDYDHDRVPYADTQTLLRVLSLMDEKVKYLTDRDQRTTTTAPVNEALAVPDASMEAAPATPQGALDGGAQPDASGQTGLVIEANSPATRHHLGEMGACDEGPEEDLKVHEELHAVESNVTDEQPAERDNDVAGDDEDTRGVSERCHGNDGDGEDDNTLRRIEELTRRIVQLEASTVTRPVPNPTGLTGDDVEHPKTLEFDGQTPVASPSHTEVPSAVPDAMPSHFQSEDDGAEELKEVAAADEQQPPSVKLQPTIEPPKDSREHRARAEEDSQGLVFPESCPPIRIMVDEEISNPNSSLQELSHTQVQTSRILQSVDMPAGAEVVSGGSPESSWLVEDDTLVMRDTSMSPELVLEPVVRSPREVREARTTKAPLRSDQITAIVEHAVPVVDTEAVMQLSRLNERIAHLEVTANEVAVKYKEAESRLLRQGYPPTLGQPSHFLPSESWVPFPDLRPPASCPVLDRDGCSHHQLAIVDIQQAASRLGPRVHQSGATSDSGYGEDPFAYSVLSTLL
ncbi:hypothetical protein FOZ60_004537 [Perkinsus olseni]|uniref:C2CD3 N-terminal C2 domain-containing protein n=1 Tax=Perkinsus olseni TaxID=32597 RepID=A0A7J6PHM0_PEROL|nr:hypothetical protein FOZ60_004537 [Perkinsus olseni]